MGSWVLGSGFSVLGSGIWVWSGSWVLVSGLWVLDFGSWVLGFGFWVLGFGFWVLGVQFGFSVFWPGRRGARDAQKAVGQNNIQDASHPELLIIITINNINK